MVQRISRHACCRLVASVGLATLLPAPRLVFAQQAPQGPQSVAELTHLFDDVYLYRSVGHQSVVIVTEEGVIATDPIGQTNPRSPQLHKAAIASVRAALAPAYGSWSNFNTYLPENIEGIIRSWS